MRHAVVIAGSVVATQPSSFAMKATIVHLDPSLVTNMHAGIHLTIARWDLQIRHWYLRAIIHSEEEETEEEEACLMHQVVALALLKWGK